MCQVVLRGGGVWDEQSKAPLWRGLSSLGGRVLSHGNLCFEHHLCYKLWDGSELSGLRQVALPL